MRSRVWLPTVSEFIYFFFQFHPFLPSYFTSKGFYQSKRINSMLVDGGSWEVGVEQLVAVAGIPVGNRNADA